MTEHPAANDQDTTSLASLLAEPEVMSSTSKQVYCPEEVGSLLGLHPNWVYMLLKTAEIWIRDHGGRHQHWGGSFRTKAEAKAEERRLLQERDARADLVRVKVTISQVFEQYLDEKKSKVKASTLQRSRELLNLLEPLIGPTQAVRLKPADVSKAYNQLQERLSKQNSLRARH